MAKTVYPFSHFYLPPDPAILYNMVSELESGSFLLLVGHRQAGKSTLAQAVASTLKKRNSIACLVYLNNLHSGTADDVFKAALKQLGTPWDQNRGLSGHEQLQKRIAAIAGLRIARSIVLVSLAASKL